MKIGFVILAHENLFRVRELVQYLSNSGAYIALHIDARVSSQLREMISYAFADTDNVFFIEPLECDWGAWNIVQATIDGVQILLKNVPDIEYIANTSGSCLPLFTLNEMRTFLKKPKAPLDYIESFAPHEEKWIIDGLSEERITLKHPFSWKNQRWLFDLNVNLRRKLRIRRRLPKGLKFALGSQWWCLTATTLRSMLNSPRFKSDCEFFKHAWIPDESFFQSLVREHSKHIIKHSLTYYHFDHQGKPYNFYDDHIEGLKHLNFLFARKIWSGADNLYRHFLNPHRKAQIRNAEIADKFQKQLQNAHSRKEMRRIGVVSQTSVATLSGKRQAASRFYILMGLDAWKPLILSENRDDQRIALKGNILKRGEIETGSTADVPEGTKDSTAIRDYAIEQYLYQQIWINRKRRFVFFATPAHLIKIRDAATFDARSHINWVRGAWIIDLAKRDFLRDENLKTIIKYFIRIENRALKTLNRGYSRCKINQVSLGELYKDPRVFNRQLPLKYIPNWSEEINNNLHRILEICDVADVDLRKRYQLEDIEYPVKSDNIVQLPLRKVNSK